MGTRVNYLVFDHNTTTNNKGYHGALQLGMVNYAKVTNNIFANTISLGHVDSRTQEQTQPEKHFSVISLDSIFEDQTIIVRNNNIYTDQSIQDVWAKYDSVSAPYEITQTIKNAIGESNVASAWYAEPLTFKTLCGAFPDYVDAWYLNPTASEFPDDWCVGGDGGYFPDEIDASYGTNAISYTKADGGFPVGDLNYYPEKKAEWEAWLPTAVRGFVNSGTEVKVYPNPFSDRVKMVVNTNKAEQIEISIFDVNGKMINQVAKQHVSQGVHEYWWDGKNANGNKVNTGIYMYKVVTSTDIQTGSLVLIK